MGWKVIGIISLCSFMFVSGFLLGGTDWSWASSGHTNEVAFWTMLGGWVSGLATIAAVIVSMTMAYQASQSGAEKLGLSFDHIFMTETSKRLNRLGEEDIPNIKILNLRSITAVINNVYIELDGISDRVKINEIRSSGALPYALHHVGEKMEFCFHINSSRGVDTMLLNLKIKGKPTFKKGRFIIETAMKQYSLKMPRDLLAVLKRRYERVVASQDESKLVSGWSQKKDIQE